MLENKYLPVLHIPAVLGVEMGVCLRTVTLSEPGQKLAPLVLEGGGVRQLTDEGELLGGRADGVTDASNLSAMNPLS